MTGSGTQKMIKRKVPERSFSVDSCHAVNRIHPTLRVGGKTIQLREFVRRRGGAVKGYQGHWAGNCASAQDGAYGDSEHVRMVRMDRKQN
jgi:hypothetical protein